MLQHTKLEVKLFEMNCFALFISLMKLRRPKSKSLYGRVCFVFHGYHVTGKQENGKIAENSSKS